MCNCSCSEKQNNDRIKRRYDADELVHAYFHGDVDLHKIFRKLGKEVVLKIISEI